MNIIWTVIRSIIYKIPLKLLLILVAVFGLLFACFSSAYSLPSSNWHGSNWYYDWLYDYYTDLLYFNSQTIEYTISNSIDFICFRSNWWWQYSLDWVNYYNLWNYDIWCTDKKTIFFKDWQAIVYYFINWEWYIPWGTMDSLQCQTEYNLIPISSVDSEYCENNNLCSSSDCPGGDLTPWVSNIFINDVFHPWAFNIIMNIPEEIDRDYTYTNSWTNFNLDVVGYNQDEEYIQSVIDVQNYKPTSEDFTRVFSNISNFWALLIACLFVILVFYMLKKAFK